MNDIVVRLSPAAHVFVRPGPALQFGVDATRAGVIDGIDEEHMSGILRTLLRARTDITWSELSRSLVEAGLPRSVAETLLEELFDYRVLRPAPTGTQDVYVLGHSPLASIITSAFTTCGFRVYPLMSGETDEEFFLRCPADTPLILVDRMPHARRLSTPLVRRRGTPFRLSTAAEPSAPCTSTARVRAHYAWICIAWLSTSIGPPSWRRSQPPTPPTTQWLLTQQLRDY